MKSTVDNNFCFGVVFKYLNSSVYLIIFEIVPILIFFLVLGLNSSFIFLRDKLPVNLFSSNINLIIFTLWFDNFGLIIKHLKLS